MFVETLYRAKRGPCIEACAEDVDDEGAEFKLWRRSRFPTPRSPLRILQRSHMGPKFVDRRSQSSDRSLAWVERSNPTDEWKKVSDEKVV